LKILWVIPLFSLVILTALSVGCSKGEKIYTESSEAIITSVNAEFTITLESNPTTGYSWKFDYDKNMLNLGNEEYKTDSKADKQMVGAGGTQFTKFKALKRGQTSVKFTYRRAWEQPSPEDKTQIFNITIK
jgi:inhibitor of cysteine peptidase